MDEILPSGLPRHVADHEVLTRLIYKRDYLKPQKAHNAFDVPSNGEISVFRTTFEPAEEQQTIISYGRSDRVCVGAAIFLASKVRELSLIIEANEAKVPKHANIINWPTLEDEREQKSLRLSIAQKLMSSGTITNLTDALQPKD